MVTKTLARDRPQEMRDNSQLLRSANSYAPETGSMKRPVILLLTNDNRLEDLVAHALLEIGGVSHLARNPNEALETVCGVPNLDLAIIDFEHGPHGMMLLRAINTVCRQLPVIVIAREDESHVAAMAYTNGAAACLAKPVSPTQLISAIRQLRRFEPELAPA
jgi:two-component system, NtrC family, phosphoglycerate transport system response regulator PgtA